MKKILKEERRRERAFNAFLHQSSTCYTSRGGNVARRTCPMKEGKKDRAATTKKRVKKRECKERRKL